MFNVGMEALIIVGAGFLIVIFAPFVNVIWFGLFLLFVNGRMFVDSWNFYTHVEFLLDPVYPSICLATLFLFSSLLRYIRSVAERRQVREAFGLYISPHFMEEPAKDSGKLNLGGDVRELTVMFTDIRSFTTISEKLTPEEWIQMRNDILTPMSDLVMENRGTIDKYMDDAVIAFWNASLDDPEHARNACLSALKMNAALVPLNKEIERHANEKGYNPVLLQAGIGINTCLCSIGNMGSGDTVNLAVRLEGQTTMYGVQILVGEETYRQAKEFAFMELDLIKVEGKEKPMRIYTLLGDETFAKDEEFRRWKTIHEGMLAAYRSGDLDCAAQDIMDARKASKGQLDAYYDIFSERIGQLMLVSPVEGWDGVFEVKVE